MFGKKIGLMVTGAVLAMFAMGHVESLAAHRGFAGSTAWAQSWDDEADDAAVDSQPPTVPNVGGSYSGTLQDHRLGTGDIAITINQTGSKLSGTWNSSFSGSGTHHFKGKVKSDSTVIMALHFHGCTVAVKGTFQNGDEILGGYKVLNCGRSDHGTIDITD
jgi:hypothetical protein